MPEVSVIIPLYNKEQSVARTLDSVLAQTFPYFEVIVVDDGSTDRGPEIVKAYRDPRVRLIYQPNRGPGAARNLAARLAAGTLLAFLDGDDTWEPEYLELSVVALKSAPPNVGAVVCNAIEHPRNRTTAARRARYGVKAGVFCIRPDTPVRTVLGMVANMHPSSVVMRRDVFISLGGFYAHNRCVYAEDADLWIKLLCCYSLSVQEKLLVHKYEQNESLSQVFLGPRPIEPFLVNPDPLLSCCPAEFQPLVRRFLAARACKTAVVYGYWGQWQTARSLISKFVTLCDRDLPYFWLARLASCRLGALLGTLLRRVPFLRAQRLQYFSRR